MDCVETPRECVIMFLKRVGVPQKSGYEGWKDGQSHPKCLCALYLQAVRMTNTGRSLAEHWDFVGDVSQSDAKALGRSSGSDHAMCHSLVTPKTNYLLKSVTFAYELHF